MKIDRSYITGIIIAVLFIGVVLADSFVNKSNEIANEEVLQESSVEIDQ